MQAVGAHTGAMSSSTPSAALAATHNTTTTVLGHSGVLPFVLGSMVLGTVGIFVHAAGGSPVTAAWCRSVFGLLGLGAWLAWRGQLSQLRLTRQTAPWALASGACLVTTWVMFFEAMTTIPASMAIVLFHVQPLWLLLFGALWLREPVGKQRWLAVLTALVGLALATGVLQHVPVFSSADSSASAPGYWWGVGLCLVGALIYAAQILCTKKAAQVPASALAWWQCLLGAAVLWLGPLASGWPAAGSWGWLVGLGLLHTALAYTLIYAGTTRLPVARIAILQYVYPAVALLIDWWYFDLQLSGLQLLGIVLMSAAIGYAERPQRGTAH